MRIDTRRAGEPQDTEGWMEQGSEDRKEENRGRAAEDAENAEEEELNPRSLCVLCVLCGSSSSLFRSSYDPFLCASPELLS
jgi:hypothetical protein